jgi:hypothetical protein
MDSGQHNDIFSMFHSFLSHYHSSERAGGFNMGGNPVQWMLQNADKIPQPQDIFKQMLETGAQGGSSQAGLAPIQSIFDGLMGGFNK